MIVAGASAYPRIIDFERMSQIAKTSARYFLVDMAHIAGLVAAGCILAGSARRLRLHHHAQDPARPARRPDPLEAAFAKDFDKVMFPGIQGGPLVHIIAAKAVCFIEAMQPSFSEYQRQVVANAKAMAARLPPKAFVSSPAAPIITCCWWTSSRGIFGTEAEKALRSRHHRQQKPIPFDVNPPMSQAAFGSVPLRSQPAG